MRGNPAHQSRGSSLELLHSQSQQRHTYQRLGCALHLTVRRSIEASLTWRERRVHVQQEEASKKMHLHRAFASIGRAAYSALLGALLWVTIVPAAHAVDGYAEDAASGCIVFKPNLKPGEAVVWKGACVKGQASGPGLARWTASDGSTLTFEGTFALGKLQGEGRMSASGGDQYVGSYKDGKRDGRGVYVSANQDRFEGQYKDNQRHGHGVLTLASGQKTEGEWSNGVQVATAAQPTPLPPTIPAAVAGAAVAVAPLTQAPQEAPPPPAAPGQSPADATPTQGSPPVLTPRQQAQQQQLARQQQQQLERQRAQEERAAQQAALQQQQREQQAERRRAYERQQTIDRILFWLLMATPALLAALVWQLKWQPAVTASAALCGWVDRREATTRDKSGYFVSFVERPFMWCSQKLFELTSTIGDQFLRAGVRLASWGYLFGLLLFLAYWVTVAVITVAIIVVFFYILGAILGENKEESRSSSSGYSPRTSYAYSDGESRHREGLLGDYTETRDANGNVVAESREREGLLGRYTETRDAEGNVVAESRERDGLLGPYTETRDADGKVIAESRRREGVLGPYTETRDADGNVVSESRERDGLLGPYTEHKRV